MDVDAIVTDIRDINQNSEDLMSTTIMVAPGRLT